MANPKPGEVQAFLETLTPRSFDWIGRTAIYRRPGRGTFTLSISGGSQTMVGLDGLFTADAGTQERIEFLFSDFMAADNYKNNPNWRADNILCVHHSSCGWEWYIARPVSLKPFHDAITQWVSLLCASKAVARG